ncbi:amino acid adenylation domain-containing protein [Sorangium sp. So ce426]
MRNKKNVEAIYPLTALQQGLLFHSLEAPAGGDPYLIQLCVRLQGRLDKDAFVRAWAKVVRRHEALRSDIEWQKTKEPIQIVYRESQPTLRTLSWRVGADEIQGRLTSFLREERARGFDVARAADLRLTLIDVGPEDFYFVWEHHHITMDGWSVANVLAEVLAQYRAEAAGTVASLPNVPPYRRYVHWLKERDQEAAVRYWRAVLAGYDSPVEFPGRRSPRHDVEPRYAEQRALLDRAVSERLRSVSREWKVTLSTYFQAVWALVIKAYTGSNDVVFGAAVSGRPPEIVGVDGMVGMFINTLPVRVRIDPREQAAAWVRRLQAQSGELRQFEHSTLPRINALGAFGRDNPLFESIVVFENYPVDNVVGGLQGVDVRVSVCRPEESLDGDVITFRGRNNYPLSLVVLPGERIEVAVSYHCDRVTHEAARSMLRLFERLTTELMSRADAPLVTIGRARSADGADASVRSAPIAALEWSRVHERIAREAERRPLALAVQFERESLTYGELDRRASRLSRWLRARGIGPESRVGVLLPRSAALVVGLVGVLKSGAAYVPMDLKLPQARLRDMIEDSGARVVLADAAGREALAGLDVEVVAPDAPDVAGAPEATQSPPVSPDGAAYVIYTSGSTGRPKGVVVTHRGVASYVQALLERLGLAEEAAMAMVSTVAADLGNTVLFGALCSGRALHLLSEERIFDPDAMAEYMHEHKVDVLKIVPSHLKGLMQAAQPERVLPRQALILGGEATSWELVAKVQHHGSCRLINHYGPTETTVGVLTHEHRPEGAAQSATLPLGRPLANSRVYVLDRELALVPAGVIGEIYIGGAGLARGYLNRPELTAERFVPDPYGGGGERLYRTGDRARYLEDGSIEFLGRIDEQVKVRGYRIELGEVRAELMGMNDVADAHVLVHEGQAGNARLVAYVIGKNGYRDGDAIQAGLRRRLPEYMVPTDFVWLETFPLTANGKLDRRALPEPGRTVKAEGALPRTEVEEKLVQIWRDVLNVERVGIHDSFFKLGGDSILTLQVVARARKVGIKLTPKQMFAHPTIAEMASVAARIVTAREPAAELVKGDVPLTPVQRWFFEQRFPDANHWNQCALFELTERLDMVALERALQAVVRHHDALRLRFQEDGEQRRQRYHEGATPSAARRVDLSRETDIHGAIARVAGDAQRSLNLESGPLLRAVYMDLGGERPGRLLLVIHHLVVDGVSWRILLEDLLVAYRQVKGGAPLVLPSKTSSFKQWSEALREYAQSETIRRELDYWRSVACAPARSLPAANPHGKNTVASARSMSAELSESETAQLLSRAPRAYRTHINDLLLTALAHALCEWSEGESALVELEGHGREDLFEGVDVTRTVGWFTTLYPVRLTPDRRDLGASIKSVKEQLRAIPNKGLGYGVCRYLNDQGKALLEGARPQITFNYLGQFDQLFTDGGLFKVASESPGASRGPDGARRAWLDVDALIHGGRLKVDLGYSAEIHDETQARALLDAYLRHLRAVIAHCSRGDVGSATPSDFPLLRMSQEVIDSLALDYRDVEDIYPMTPMQQGLWMHSILSAGSGIYHMQNVYRVKQPVDTAAFQEAWRRVVQRHPILRTAFLFHDDVGPIQVVHEDPGSVCECMDWTDIGEEAQRAALDALQKEELRRGFDLSKPRSFTTRLIRCSAEESYFMSSYHHILMDAWCGSLVLRDFFAYYHALVLGREPELPGVPPFKTYVAWLSRQSVDEARAFWRRDLEGFRFPTPIGSAAISDDGGLANHRVDDVYEYLSEDATGRLDALAKRLELTPNTITQAAWALVLARHSGLDDVVFGVTVAGRPVEIKDAESILGLFIQSIPLRVGVDRTKRASAWIREIFEKNVQIRQYEHLALTEIRQCSEVRGKSLFHSLFVFENAPFDEAVVEKGALFGAENLSNRTHTNYPMTVVLYPGKRLGLHLSYNSQIFGRDEAEMLLRHFRVALEELIHGEDKRLGSISILDEQEREMLENINRTRADRSATTSYVELFERQVRSFPERIVATCGQRSWSYAELNARSNRVGHALIELGVGLDDVVAVLDERGLELLGMVLGTFKAGAGYLPLDPRHPAQRVAEIVKLSRPRVIISRESLRPFLQGVLQPVPEGERAELLFVESLSRREVPETNPGIHGGPRNLSYVIYTSGSTGTPKGVMVEQRGMLNNQLSKVPYLGLTEGDVIAQTASQCFDISVWQLLTAPLCGAVVDIVTDEIAHDPIALFDHAAERGITVLESVPSLVSSALASGRLPPADRLRLRWLLPTGEALPADVAQRWLAHYPQVPLINAYGPAECSDDVSLYTVRDVRQLPAARGGYVPIGLPVDNTQLYIVDQNLDLVATGVTGELCVGGVGVGRGYVRDPAKTAEAYVPSPFADAPGERLYRTGDLARYRPDGVIEYVGRLDHQVKVRGYRIELGEIEARLLAQPGVTAAVVVAREDAPGDRRLVAYVVPAREGLDAAGVEEQGSFRDELRAGLKSVLPDYMVPSMVMLLGSLPLSANGKVDRRALPAPEGGQLQRSYVGPRNDIEQKVAEIWSDVLGVPRVGIHDNFFELGGHSLSAVRMTQALGRALKRHVPLALAFQSQTVAELAEALAGQQRSDTLNTLVAMGGGGSRSPLYCLHAGGGHVLHYRPLALQLQGERPIYGVQSRSFYLEGWVDDSIGSMAEHYVDEIERSRRGGAVNLLGYSLGGVIAIEVARVCERRGLDVGFVGLVDPTGLLDEDDRTSGAPEDLVGSEHQQILSGWIERSLLRAKWERLWEVAGQGTRGRILRSFIERDLAEKKLDLIEERELFDSANTQLLMDGYHLRPISSDVHVWWASASLERRGSGVNVRDLESKLRLASSVVLEGDHASIILDDRLRDGVRRSVSG